MNRIAAAMLCLAALAAPTARAQGADTARGREDRPSVRVNVEVQFRYLFNHIGSGGPQPLDANEGGFQVRRARVVVSGSVLSPRLTFRVRPAYDRATGVLQLDDAWVAWALGNDWSVQMGQFKPQFLREENVGGFSQLTAERTYAADYYTIDYTQGVELSWTGRRLHPSLALHDGSYGANTDFHADRTDYAVVARLEWLPIGEWRGFTDFNGWSSEGRGLLIGAAMDHERGESDTTQATPHVTKYTVDVTAKISGASLSAVWTGQHFAADTMNGIPTQLMAARQSALMVQAAAFAIRDRLEIYGRLERIDFDGVYYRNDGAVAQSGSRNLTWSRMRTATLGANWYVRQHATKFTADVLVVPDHVPVTNTGSGLLRSDAMRQVVVRTQAQFRF